MSHIHFLSKLPNMSNKSHEKLFNIVRNNVIDIIRPNKIDSLINKDYVKFKECSNNITEDCRMCLRYICNAYHLVPDENGNLICRAINYVKSKLNTISNIIDLSNKLLQAYLE